MRILEQLPVPVRVPEPVPKTYHVFINHRGPDTKKNLASLIYRELNRYGLRVFLDKEELPAGETLSLAIRRAIHSAFVHITIFSKRYAESRWCLEELFWILRVAHEHTIIPVFYEVEPYHLRNIDREPYADAFEKHKRKDSMEVVERWKEALKEVSYISGLVVNNERALNVYINLCVVKATFLRFHQQWQHGAFKPH